eukprot:scaffold59403_cov22-Prasinocladus_malaysianus.AAC.2
MEKAPDSHASSRAMFALGNVSCWGAKDLEEHVDDGVEPGLGVENHRVGVVAVEHQLGGHQVDVPIVKVDPPRGPDDLRGRAVELHLRHQLQEQRPSTIPAFTPASRMKLINYHGIIHHESMTLMLRNHA